jgi:hypothetical protein
MAKAAESIKRGLEQAVEHAQRTAPPVDPGTRGLSIDTCDQGHQAIAFAGSCPLCRRKARGPHQGTPPLDEGHMIYAADLERMLRAHYAAGGAGARS